MNWPKVAVGDVSADIRSGFASGGDDPNGVVQFRMNNVERSGAVNWDKLRRVPNSKVRNELLVHPGDILFNATNSPELVGKTALFAGFREPVTFSNHFIRIRADVKHADPGYVSRWLQREFERGKFAGMCRSWVNQASITKDQLSSLEIPLPPLPEQRRIAAILDKADALRRKRKRAIELLDSLTQSVFLEMFGNLPSSRLYPRGTISSWVADFTTGKNLAPDPDGTLSGYRVLKVSAVTSGRFVPLESKPLPPSYAPPLDHLVRRGDLLFSRANTAELIGATAIVDQEYDRLVLPDKIWRFVWNSTNPPNPNFVHALFSSTGFRRELSKRATGTSGSMKNISKEKVLQIPLALPPRGDQDRFVEISRRISNGAKASLAQNALFEAQLASLQSRAFSGQL